MLIINNNNKKLKKNGGCRGDKECLINSGRGRGCSVAASGAVERRRDEEYLTLDSGRSLFAALCKEDLTDGPTNEPVNPKRVGTEPRETLS